MSGHTTARSTTLATADAHLRDIYAVTWATRANQSAAGVAASCGQLARSVRVCYTERARNIRTANIARRTTW